MTNPSESALKSMRTIINRTECPKCGVQKKQQCVYMQTPVPGHPRDWYRQHRYWSPKYTNPWDRYELSGKPMEKFIHSERRELDRHRHAARIRRQREQPLPRGLSPDGNRAAQAMRKWDVDEYARLVSWWREWGWLIENADAMRPDGTVRGDTYCLPPRGSTFQDY